MRLTFFRFSKATPSLLPDETILETSLHKTDHQAVVRMNEIIDVDAVDSENDDKAACKGIVVSFPDGQSYHTSYPFGLHTKLQLPWHYHCAADDIFHLQSNTCEGTLVKKGSSPVRIHRGGANLS